MKLTDYTAYTKLGKLEFTIVRVSKKSLLLNNNYCFSVYMHHYAETVTEGWWGTLVGEKQQMEKRTCYL